MAWHYKICPICNKEADDMGFCGCEPPFKLDAMPSEKITGIARTIYPRILAYFQVPENQKKFESWQKEFHRRKAAGIAPAIPPTSWSEVPATS